MEYHYLLVEEISKGLSRIALNRPEKHNALSLELMEELCAAFIFLENSSCQAVILSAEGKNFCSGLDLQQAANETLIEKMGLQLVRLFTLLHHTSLVTIAAVQGDALAGGGGLAASCDMVLLAENGRMGFPETRRGIIAAQVAVILVRQLAIRHVRELLLTAQAVDSRKALEMGLVNRVVKHDELQSEALRLAGEILKGAPEAIKKTKHLLEKLAPGDFSHDLELALSFHHAARHSKEGREGIASFLEKREPKW